MAADSASRYHLLKPLARSETGVVYLAQDTLLERLVAFTLLSQDISTDGARRERVVRWFRRTAHLRHPNIVALFDYGEHDNQLFIAMEYVAGVTLAEILRHGPVPVPRTLEWMERLGSALDYAHRTGIVHGDLNLDRLKVDTDDAVKVLDFEIWTVEPESLPAGSLPAKANYRSPEQLEGHRPDRQSDVFAFGAIFYELLSGRPAFPGEPGSDPADRVVHAEPESLSRLRPELPPGIIAIVERCLEKDRALRYPNMEHAHRDLARLKIERHIADARAMISDRRFSQAIEVLDDALALAPDRQDVIELLEQGRRAIVRERAERSADAVFAAEPAAQPGPRPDENVQFTVYRPAAIAVERWYPMLVFAHLSARRKDASADEPDPVEQVRQQAKEILGETDSGFVNVRQDSSQPIPSEGHLRLVPLVPGVEFNPPERSFVWLESVHREEFRLRAARQIIGQTARGFVSVYLDRLLIADVPIAMAVQSQAPRTSEPVPNTAGPYRRIFASYSHRDAAVVRQFEEYARGFGDRYMRDVIDLRSGEVWERRLGEMIESADVFQLFWSWNSIDSPYVRSEWEHALTLNRAHFIRPVYWEDPLPQRGDLPPAALRALHFARVGLPAYSAPIAQPTAGSALGSAHGSADRAPSIDFPVSWRVAESERKRRTEEDARRAAEEERSQRELDLERKRRAEVEARRAADEEREPRRAEEEERRRAAEEESRRRREAELERRRRAEEDARRVEDQERRQREAEAQSRKEARRAAEEESRRQLHAELERRRAEAAAQRAEKEERRRRAEERPDAAMISERVEPARPPLAAGVRTVPSELPTMEGEAAPKRPLPVQPRRAKSWLWAASAALVFTLMFIVTRC